MSAWFFLSRTAAMALISHSICHPGRLAQRRTRIVGSSRLKVSRGKLATSICRSSADCSSYATGKASYETQNFPQSMMGG
eukprot:1871631-Amphidinium_carterae.2